jgi:hypothetical protein
MDAAPPVLADEEDERWLESGRYFAPEQSLARADSKATVIVANVSLISAAIGGFGLINSTATEPRFDRHLLEAAVLLAFVALISAVLTLVPSGRSEVNIYSPSDIKDAFTRTIAHRRRLLVTSFVTLVAALILIGAAIVGRRSSGQLSMTATIDHSGAVSINAQITYLPKGSILRVVAEESFVSEPPQILFLGEAVTNGADGGTVSGTTRSSVSGGSVVVCSMVVSPAGRVTLQRSIALTSVVSHVGVPPQSPSCPCSCSIGLPTMSSSTTSSVSAASLPANPNVLPTSR